MMPVAILAGGFGTRLGSLTQDTPKSLIKINKIPFIDWQLSYLKSQGITKVVICVSHKAEDIVSHLKSGLHQGVEIKYSYDNPENNGTGGAIKNALPYLGEKFMVLYGDSYLPVKYVRIIEAFIKNNYEAMITVYKNNSKHDKSNVKYLSDGSVYYKKNSSVKGLNFIDYGLNFFSANVFNNLPEIGFLDLSDVLANLSEKKRLASYEVFERFYEIGSLQGIKDLGKFLREKNVNIQ
jgi:NDP-sugar pyrophosphorylase family protein